MERVKDGTAVVGKRLMARVKVLTPPNAKSEAKLFGIKAPPLDRGCVFCAHDPSLTPGTYYLRLGWTDGGPEVRAPPSYAPVCRPCLTDMEIFPGDTR